MSTAGSRAPGRNPRSRLAGAGELLLEIGTEELPYQVVPAVLVNLGQSAERLLKEHRLSHGNIRTFGTPRRLVLLVESLATQQAAWVKENLGPPKAVAFDADGKPTKAALGFAASQGVPVSDLETRHTLKGEYLAAVKREKGVLSHRILQDLLPDLIGGLSFPKTMRWNATGFRFARPIRWLLALFDERVIPFQVAEVKAGNCTRGHRFYGTKGSAGVHILPVKNMKAYLSGLESRAVIPDQEKRRKLVLAQLTRLAESVKGSLDQDEDLLEQAVYSVEYPQALLGTFAHTYLSLPKEILQTSMKEHQGFFSLAKQNGALLPMFISVANMKSGSMKLIREGNERVLAARLADAKFFFEEDRKTALVNRVERLKSVTFHQKLGTLYQKTDRVRVLAGKLAEMAGCGSIANTVKRAAQLSKADLLTGMVGEFPTLQGIMGGEYAKMDGETEEVSLAIRDQYLPRAMEGELPRTSGGKILSLADRIDTIVAFFSVGIVPTGSEDPLGLRRHATAIVRIVIEGGLKLDLVEILLHAKKNVEAQGFTSASGQRKSGEQPPQDPFDFIIERLRYYGRVAHGLRDDVMEAVLRGRADGPMNLMDVCSRMKALQAMTLRPEFDPLMVGFKRAHRLIQKERWDPKSIVQDNFQHPTEGDLYRHLEEAKVQVPACLSRGQYTEGLEHLVGMKPAIDAFFTGVLVNADDPALRANRLSLLEAVDGLFMSFADFSQIAVQGG